MFIFIYMNNFELDNKKDESVVDIKRHKQMLRGKEVEYAVVSRKTADVDSLLTLISKYDTGIDRMMIQHCMGLFKRAVLEKLESGRAVNVLGLGTMYINAKLDADGNPNLSLGFTPSPEAAQAVKNIETVVTDSETLQPEITEVYDLQTKYSGGTISPDSDIRIHGKRIKLADYEDSRSFVAFAPCNKNGTITETDKSMWQKVYAADLSTNKPSELQFYVPKFLPEGTYKIIVSTHFLKNGKKAKTAARTCQSEQIIKVLQEQ